MHKISWLLWILIIIAAVYLYAHPRSSEAPVINTTATASSTDISPDVEVNVISMSSSTPVIVTSATTTATSGTITLGVGQTTQVGDLKLTLNSFVQDNRCPTDVRCIEAGAVTVNVTATQPGQTVTQNFASDEAPHAYGKYKVSITDIKPARKSTEEITSKQYRITFHIELH